jgi:surfeit locus 1 family protein
MRFKLIPTLAYLCVLPVLVALGIWQLNRAEEKQLFFKIQQQRVQSGVITLTSDTQVDITALKYNTVRVTGHYDNSHQFLLDNQINTGIVGYFVLTPFVLEDSTKAVLVNRGWIPLKARTQLPQINVVDTQMTIVGRINTFPGVGIKLPGADIPAKSWPSVVGVANSGVLSKTLGYPLFAFQVELAADQANGYKRDWQTTTVMRPEQHTAYAVQWFVLALTLSLLFIRYSFKKH